MFHQNATNRTQLGIKFILFHNFKEHCFRHCKYSNNVILSQAILTFFKEKRPKVVPPTYLLRVGYERITQTIQDKTQQRGC